MRTKCHIEEIEQRELDSYDLIEVPQDDRVVSPLAASFKMSSATSKYLVTNKVLTCSATIPASMSFCRAAAKIRCDKGKTNH